LKNVSGCLEVCPKASKHVFNHSKRSKISFFEKKVSGGLDVFANASKHVFNQRVRNIFFEKKFLVVWMYAQMHQNTFVTTSDGQKYLF
jgi:hypothetical protein